MRRPIVAAGNDRGGSPHGKTRCVIAAADPCFEAVLFVKVIRAFLGYPRVSGMGDFIPRAVGMGAAMRTLDTRTNAAPCDQAVVSGTAGHRENSTPVGFLTCLTFPDPAKFLQDPVTRQPDLT